MALRGARAVVLLAGTLLLPASPVWAAVPGGAGAAELASFLHNLTQWFEYLAGLFAVATVAYGGLRHTLAHSARAQADAWRIVLAGLGGLVIALLAPTVVGIVQGLIPS